MQWLTALNLNSLKTTGHLPHSPLRRVGSFSIGSSGFTIFRRNLHWNFCIRGGHRDEKTLTDNCWAKAAWVLGFGAFLALELSTLYQQRAEDSDTEQANTKAEDDKIAGLLNTEHESFGKVLEQNQKQFDATMKKSNKIVELNRATIAGVQESINTVTGGDSFAGLQPVATGNNYHLVFTLVPGGKYPLHALTVRGFARNTYPQRLSTLLQICSGANKR